MRQSRIFVRGRFVRDSVLHNLLFWDPESGVKLLYLSLFGDGVTVGIEG